MTPVELANEAIDRIKCAEIYQASEDCPFTDFAGREMLKGLFGWFQAAHKRLPDSRSQLEDFVESERVAGRVPTEMVFWALDPSNDFWEKWFYRVAHLWCFERADSVLRERYKRQGKRIPDDETFRGSDTIKWPPDEIAHEIEVATEDYLQGRTAAWYSNVGPAATE
jgi:hypothetical protein